MATATPTPVYRHLCRFLSVEHTGRLSDPQLLERFTLHHEEAAFTALVRRHGPLVLNVCRRVLHNWHDAEDAFQATFLILARKARSIARQESVASWLYQVAYRTAIRARARAATRQQHEHRVVRQPADGTLAEVTGREFVAVLDEELNQLPARYRAPLVLCYLQGRTRDQAARQLGWSPRELKHRLEQARKRLRTRLANRGLALPAALLAAGLVSETAWAALPGPFITATVQAIMQPASESVAANVLAAETLQAMAAGKFKIALAMLLALAVALVGVGLLARQLGGLALARADGDNAPPKAPAKEANRPARPAAVQNVAMVGKVLDIDGRPLAGAEAAVIGLPKGSSARGLWLMSNKGLARGQAGTDGKIRLTLSRRSLASYERFYLVAGAAGHGLAWEEIKRDKPRAETVVRLSAEKIIRGRILDLQGLPAAGAVVRVSWLGRGGQSGSAETRLGELPNDKSPLWPARAVTGKDGKFILRGLNPGLHGFVHVEADRFAPHYIEITAGTAKAQEVNLVLAPAQLIEGIVTAADTNKPLANVKVSANSDQNAEAPEAMGPGVSGKTDAKGHFRLNPPTGKLFTVRAVGAEGEPYLRAKETFKWNAGAVRQELKLALPRGVLIHGKVTEAASGKPVAGAVLRDTVGLWINPTVSTSRDGTFQIAVRPGRGHLLVKGPGNDYIPLEITADELEGRKPRGRRMYPDAIVPFDLKPGAPVKEVVVRLKRGVTIRGRLVGPGGHPPQNAIMLCWSQVHQYAPSWFAASVQLADGRFELHGCDPARTYQVHFLDASHERGVTVQLSAKKAAGKPVTVRLQPCGSAEVRFVDKDAKPATNRQPIFYIVARRGKGSPAGESDDSDFVANVDRFNYPGAGRPVDAKGRSSYPALIPGAIYRILDYNLKSVKDFTVKPGEKLKLGDIVIRDPN